jgi:DNA-binding SARP family transcriptional activator
MLIALADHLQRPLILIHRASGIVSRRSDQAARRGIGEIGQPMPNNPHCQLESRAWRVAAQFDHGQQQALLLAPRATNQLSLRLLGEIRVVEAGSGQLQALGPALKAGWRMLSLLAEQEQPISRAELAELLWPQDGPIEARANLKQVLRRFNQLAAPGSLLIEERAKMLSLNKQLTEVDVTALTEGDQRQRELTLLHQPAKAADLAQSLLARWNIMQIGQPPSSVRQQRAADSRIKLAARSGSLQALWQAAKYAANSESSYQVALAFMANGHVAAARWCYEELYLPAAIGSSSAAKPWHEIARGAERITSQPRTTAIPLQPANLSNGHHLHSLGGDWLLIDRGQILSSRSLINCQFSLPRLKSISRGGWKIDQGWMLSQVAQLDGQILFAAYPMHQEVSDYYLHILGQSKLRQPAGGEIALDESSFEHRLLIELASYGFQPVSRARLASQLWPGPDLKRARANLKQLLSRSLLLPAMLIISAETLQLNKMLVRTDLDQLTRSWQTCSQIIEQGQLSSSAGYSEACLKLHPGTQPASIKIRPALRFAQAEIAWLSYFQCLSADPLQEAATMERMLLNTPDTNLGALLAIQSAIQKQQMEAARGIYDRFYRPRSNHRIDWLALVDELSASSSFQQAIMEHSPRAIATPKTPINLPFAS